MAEFQLQQSPQRQIRSTDAFAQRGSWTPVFTFETPGDLNVAYAIQKASYVRVLNLVFASWRIFLSTFTHSTATGNALLTGLPFAALGQESALVYMFGNTTWQGVSASAGYTQMTPQIIPGESQLRFILNGSGKAGSTLGTSWMPTSGSPAFAGSILYPAAD